MAEANHDSDVEEGGVMEDIYDVPRHLLEVEDQIYANVANTKPIPVLPHEPIPPPLPSKTKPRLPEKPGLSSVRSHDRSHDRTSSTESSPDVLKQRPTPRPRLSLQHKAGSKPTPKPRIKRQNRSGTLTLVGATITESNDVCPERVEPAGRVSPIAPVAPASTIPDEYECDVYEEFNPASPVLTEVDQSIYEPISEPNSDFPPLASFRPKSLNSSAEEKTEYEEAINHVDADRSSDERVVIGAESESSYQAVWNMASGRAKIPEASPGPSPRESTESFQEPSFSPPPLPPGYQPGPPPPPPPRVSSFGHGLKSSTSDCSAEAPDLSADPFCDPDPFAPLDQRTPSAEGNVYNICSTFSPSFSSPPTRGPDPFEGLFDASRESLFDLDGGIPAGASLNSHFLIFNSH
ncbi:hypothetical protein CAPTEDRAFT_210965 [Capitella teleta]|uniref:Uncharacterized protein n=1 Tax=Capitella teleta TaxID=283909 RepID=R7TAX8_CAPTE|nr:hypothetical protein CAPTEDRAFT_210965 [Capitella teleta]|eukprot:ELT90849.1 hypothetical protein CAPTEDRAFT_210965 [Capitella teleta]